MKKGFSLIILILWLLVSSLYLPARQEVARAEIISPLAGAIKIQQSQATPDFPNSIKFNLTAAVASNVNVEKITLNFQLVGNAPTLIRTADVKQTAPTTQASVTINSNRDYIPPGTHINYYWEFTDKDTNVFDSPIQELVYQDKRFTFHEITGGVVTVRWYQGSDAFGKAALDKALATIDRLGKEYNIKPTKNINITIYPDQQTMFSALPPNTAEWVGGQAIPAVGTIVLSIPPGNMTEINRSIPHEVTHQVNYQATKNPYNTLPRWLDEGLAVNNQDQVEGFLNEAFQRGIDKQNLIPLRVLGGNFPADSQQSYMAYGESVNVVKYILKKYGSAGIGKILASFKNGVSYDEAIQAGLGIGLDELDREWKQSFGYPLPSVSGSPSVLEPATAAGLVTGVSKIVYRIQNFQPKNSDNLAIKLDNSRAANDNYGNLLLAIMGVAALTAVASSFSLVITSKRK